MRGPSFWKFNNSLLQDEIYCINITQLIETTLKSADKSNIRNAYEFVKNKIQQFSIKHSKTKAKQNRERELILKQQLYTHEKKINDGLIEIDELKIYDKIKDEYDQILDYRTKGSWIRSRIENIELNEKSTKYVLEKEKQSFAKKNINQIVNNQAIEINDEKQILSELKNYYVNLYKTTYNVIPDYKEIDALGNLPCLSNYDKETLEEDITL